MSWETISGAGTTTATKFHGDWGNYISNMFNASDISRTVSIHPNVTWTFKNGSFKLRNPADTFSYTIVPAAIAADRTLNLPLLTGTDTIAVLGTAQTFTADQTLNDNINLVLGTGGDVTFDYDGTDLKINPQVVGSGNADIVAGNLDVLTGTVQEAGVDISPIGTQDIPVPASAMWASTTSGAGGLTKVETTSNKQDFQVWEFDSAADESVQFSIPFPRQYNNQTLTCTFYWTNAAGLTTETVDWAIKGIAIGNDDAWDVAWGAEITTTDTWIAQGDIHSVTSAAITLGGTPQDADFAQFQITRKTATDNLTGDARLLGVVLHITTDAATSA